jgi:nitrite reductase/ring-hydroxylating ferredoxin subunit
VQTTRQPPFVTRPLEDGWTLPASWYSDETVLQLERKRIFTAAWQYAGPAELVAEPGSFFASVAGHIPVVVTRAKDGELRGFVNVCRHRGHVVAEGAGCRATLQCPYHAWTYELDGTLRKAPRSDREPGFDPSGISLLPVSIDTWGPFMFVNPDLEAPPLRKALSDLPEIVVRSGLDLDGIRFHSHVQREQPVNWKVALENYLASCHCQSQYHFVWPNTTINISPGRQNVSIERWVPLGARATVEATDWFFREGVPTERIEEVIATGVVEPGRLMPESNPLVAAFQRRVHDSLLQAG